MRIIDKNTDFYDYWQDIYLDRSITFDRTDSYLLTKEIMCGHLNLCIHHHRWCGENQFALLQICNTFWLFLFEITKKTDYGTTLDYSVELLATWKNYRKPRRLISLDIISFVNIDRLISTSRKLFVVYDRDKISKRIDAIIQAVDTNDFRIDKSIQGHTVLKGDGTREEKHIPLLKACGIAKCIDPLEVFLAFEEYFSLEKSSLERTESKGLTDGEKIGNHGFDVKTSFRGKS